MSFILLSHWNGRFGNRMHQYAYGATYAKLNNVPFYLPSDWEGTHLFKNQYHTVIEDDTLRLEINQTHPSMNTTEFRTQSIKKLHPDAKQIHPEMNDQNYLKYDHPVFFDSVCAYSQTIFDSMDKEYLLKVFEFSDKVKNTEAYKYWSSVARTYDVAHLRRDDISNSQYNNANPQGYSVISKDSYYKAFKTFNYNPEDIIWISDDYIGKWHTNRPSTPVLGWSYPIGSNYDDSIVFDWLEDFLKLYFARIVFRANSSFSWWASFLSPSSKVYSPVLDKQIIYGRGNDGIEIDINFVEGNHPHWMYNNSDIIIK
jgi:hypothetical protein